LILLVAAGCPDGSTQPAVDHDAGDAGPSGDAMASDADGSAGTDGGEVGLEMPALQARPVSGRWLAGDFHVHATGASNDTGGNSTPERIKEVGVMRGLDFLVLTDHSNSTGSDPSTLDEDPALFNQGPEFPYWDEAARLSDDTFLMVDGNEMSPRQMDNGPTGHVGCYPRDLATFDPDVAFVDRPRGEVTGAQTLQQAHDAGCFATVNHPFGPAPWIAFDWTSRDYDGIEVFNGGAGWDQFDYQAVEAYACDLSLGQVDTAMGGSDNHRVNQELPGTLTNPPLALPHTWVFADSLDWSTIVAGLDAHRVTISDTGTPMDVDVYAADGTWLAMTGGEFDASSGAILRARGALANSQGEARTLQFVRVTADACDDTRMPRQIIVPDPHWEIVDEVEVEADSTFDVTVSVTPQPGDAYFAWLHPGTSRVIQKYGVAISNAVRAR